MTEHPKIKETRRSVQEGVFGALVNFINAILMFMIWTSDTLLLSKALSFITGLLASILLLISVVVIYSANSQLRNLKI